MLRQRTSPIGPIGNYTVEQIITQYNTELFSNFLPNMDKFVLDHQYGGFMCDFDISTAQRVSENKRAWYEGRGIWLYSFLYNHLDAKDHYLAIAAKSKDLILPHLPIQDDFFPASFNRKGEKLTNDGDIFANLYIAEGLIEYGIASNTEKYIEIGKELMQKSIALYDNPSYRYSPFDHLSAPRLLNHWMVILRIASRSLEYESDSIIDQVVDRCLDVVLTHHLNADYQLLNEVLTYDLHNTRDEYAHICNFGVSIQILWMIMYEAERRGDRTLFLQAADMFKRHVTVAKDEVYGGYLGYLNRIDRQNWRVNKILGLHEEILIGSLFLIEHMNDTWAKQCFEETYRYIQDNFVKDDYVFWISSGDRKVDVHQKQRVECYHHPRHLMLNLLSLKRIQKRQGNISDFLYP